jgi:hypothetical protein
MKWSWPCPNPALQLASRSQLPKPPYALIQLAAQVGNQGVCQRFPFLNRQRQCLFQQLGNGRGQATTDTSPCVLRVGLTVISTSCPRAVRKSMRRSTEKAPERFRINAET